MPFHQNSGWNKNLAPISSTRLSYALWSNGLLFSKSPSQNLHHLYLFLLTHTTGFQPRPRPPARRKRTFNSYGFGRCSRGGKAATTTPVRTPPTRMNSNWRGGTLGIKIVSEEPVESDCPSILRVVFQSSSQIFQVLSPLRVQHKSVSRMSACRSPKGLGFCNHGPWPHQQRRLRQCLVTKLMFHKGEYVTRRWRKSSWHSFIQGHITWQAWESCVKIFTHQINNFSIIGPRCKEFFIDRFPIQLNLQLLWDCWGNKNAMRWMRLLKKILSKHSKPQSPSAEQKGVRQQFIIFIFACSIGIFQVRNKWH